MKLSILLLQKEQQQQKIILKTYLMLKFIILVIEIRYYKINSIFAFLNNLLKF